ncbi:MAG: hypothetical protein RMK74_15225 [Myxococcales bacterium]|nr:hypothetical protein [Myxococcales bacterium]
MTFMHRIAGVLVPCTCLLGASLAPAGARADEAILAVVVETDGVGGPPSSALRDAIGRALGIRTVTVAHALAREAVGLLVVRISSPLDLALYYRDATGEEHWTVGTLPREGALLSAIADAAARLVEEARTRAVQFLLPSEVLDPFTDPRPSTGWAQRSRRTWSWLRSEVIDPWSPAWLPNLRRANDRRDRAH